VSKKDETIRLRVEADQNEADHQAKTRWTMLLQTLQELNGYSLHGTQFKWNHDAGLLYGEMFARLRYDYRDRFVGHVSFRRLRQPDVVDDYWQLIPTLTKEGSFGWRGTSNALPLEEESIALDISTNLARLNNQRSWFDRITGA
jgi:hypothetical protein